MSETLKLKTKRRMTVQQLFHACHEKDKAKVETMLAENFTFTSPYNDRIDKREYFEQCWPYTDIIRDQIIEHIAADENGVFVTYLAKGKNGKTFRNTEFFTFDSDNKISAIDVYFGAEYRNGDFVAQKPS